MIFAPKHMGNLRAGERFLRVILLMAVFAVAGWLFWKSSERTMEKIQARDASFDLTGTLSPEHKEQVIRYKRALKEKFGLDLEIIIADREIAPPDPDPKTIFLGVNPNRGRAVAVFPPLVDRALDPNFKHYLAEKHFLICKQAGRWPDCLDEALILIYEQIEELNRPAEDQVGG